MRCDEADFLLGKYAKTVVDYMTAVRKYRDIAVDLPMVEFVVIQHTCEYAREKCDIAHKALQQHRVEHHCL